MFNQTIINWYLKHKRDLPWRHTTDAYVIWLSEIILQQTRIEQGLPYFNRFITKYPTIKDFANASEDDILHLWQGLGYYSRGRNMHHTAKEIITDYHGKFPSTYTALIKLKGIGSYTAAAIASFAFGESKAVVDGNVYRVLARHFGISTAIDTTAGKKEFAALAQSLIDPAQPGEYNQAVMEFGALHCRPANPVCETCPLAATCVALAKNIVAQLPVKSKKVNVRKRYFDYLLILDEEQCLYLSKRTQKDIWHNLYEFPCIESEKLLSEAELINSNAWQELTTDLSIVIHTVNTNYTHQLTHQLLHARFWRLEHKGTLPKKPLFLVVKKEQLHNYALPRLLTKYYEAGI